MNGHPVHNHVSLVSTLQFRFISYWTTLYYADSCWRSCPCASTPATRWGTPGRPIARPPPQAWLPDGYSQISRSYLCGPLGFWTMAPLCYAAKFDPFLSLDCAPTHSTLGQSKEKKGSDFAIWQPWPQRPSPSASQSHCGSTRRCTR